MATAVLAGGCFWCTEAVFALMDGVTSVEPGYCGGHVDQPTYEQICQKNTGHIEVVRISFDDQKVSYRDLLEVFFATHDPTTPGRQGADVGPQYQSAVFCQNDEQHDIAQEVMDALDTSGTFGAPICTKLLPAATFWVAEDYHHDFFARNPYQGYCQFVIAPKIDKMHKQFVDRIKR
jgi:peptide-methionine (S)-S-oxide reductase